MAIARFTLTLPVTFQNEDGWVVASFPNLDVSSQGRTQQDATRNVIEAAQLFLEDCFERGMLDQVLKDCGFTILHGVRQTLPTGDELTVPVELLAASNGCEAHAG